MLQGFGIVQFQLNISFRMKYHISAFLLCIVISSFGQQYMDTTNPKEIKSILSKDNELNGFGGATIKIGDINLDRAVLVGAYGGVLINRNFMFISIAVLFLLIIGIYSP